MNAFTRWRRSAAALAVAAAVVPLAATRPPAQRRCAPRPRPSYTHATYLQHALGLPASDTNPVIESVTYDRFQWLLQQPGNFAFLIGDPATDATFAARAQDVEAAAKAAGVKKVYWFNPNLSGSAKVGTVTEPNLDIRNPAGITSLPAASQTKYGNAWLNLVGQYLGNGVTASVNGLNGESATVDRDQSAMSTTPAPRRATAPRSATRRRRALRLLERPAPANVQHSFFFIYNKDQHASAASRRRSSPGST